MNVNIMFEFWKDSLMKNKQSFVWSMTLWKDVGTYSYFLMRSNRRKFCLTRMMFGQF